MPNPRLSSGVVVINRSDGAPRFLLLRAYRNWDFPKGLVETGETPLAAAVREVEEETTLRSLAFDWGEVFIETGPYNHGKIARYYIARSDATHIELPINPELGMPEHHESRWVSIEESLVMVTERLQPVVRWAAEILLLGLKE